MTVTFLKTCLRRSWGNKSLVTFLGIRKKTLSVIVCSLFSKELSCGLTFKTIIIIVKVQISCLGVTETIHVGIQGGGFQNNLAGFLDIINVLNTTRINNLVTVKIVLLKLSQRCYCVQTICGASLSLTYTNSKYILHKGIVYKSVPFRLHLNTNTHT